MQLAPEAVTQLLLPLASPPAERRDHAAVRDDVGLHARRLDGAQHPERAVHLAGLSNVSNEPKFCGSFFAFSTMQECSFASSQFCYLILN